MTRFAKVLVFVNLAVSLMLMTWAMMLYKERIDWSNTPAKAGQRAGELVAREAQVRDLRAGLPVAEARWRRALRGAEGRPQRPDPDMGVWALEELRDADRLWYLDEMNLLRAEATEANPARMVELQKGVPVTDPARFNRPKMVPATDRFGKPLQSLAAYNQQWQLLLEQVAQVQREYEKLFAEDADLSEKITAIRKVLAAEKDKREGLVEERKLVEPQLVNTVVDSELILKRKQALEKRLQELRDPSKVARRR